MKNSILIVDDSEDTRELFKATLEAEGYGVMDAKDGQQALDLLRAHGDFALMLLDLRMPGLSGLEVLEQMDRQALGRGTRVMVVSAVDELPVMKLPINVIGTLKKPFFYPELIFKIKQILGALTPAEQGLHP